MAFEARIVPSIKSLCDFIQLPPAAESKESNFLYKYNRFAILYNAAPLAGCLVKSFRATLPFNGMRQDFGAF
jgi:hypothetical protein